MENHSDSEKNAQQSGSEGWERDTIIKLAESSLKEQRSSRRWNVFFRFLWFAILGIFLYYMMQDSILKQPVVGEHTALIELKGVISEGTNASSAVINKLLAEAFEAEKSKAVILEINSPGGTPVQAANIYHEILRLREEHPQKKLYAVVSDICASGGYYVASAADEIYAGKSSMLGSIGVIMSGFGVNEFISRLGVEDRTLTAGKDKALLNPFAPRNLEQEAHMQNVLNEVHREFIKDVTFGRSGKLSKEVDVFSGLMWSGREAIGLGLIDQFGDAGRVAREIIKVEEIVVYEPEKTLYEQLTEGASWIMAKAMQRFMTEQGYQRPMIQ